jgi:hypothetical protein
MISHNRRPDLRLIQQPDANDVIRKWMGAAGIVTKAMPEADVVPDRAEAERFLKLLDPTATKFTFQTFDDNKDRKAPALARIFHGPLTEHFDTLAVLNAVGAGVFITINATDFSGRSIANIVRVRCLFADFDKRSDAAPATQPQRHILVKSSPGKWHVYWRVNGIELNAFTPLQLAIIHRYDTDPSVKDLPRVMRLPGFVHRKEAPFMVNIVEANDIPPYGAADFVVDEAEALAQEDAGRRAAADPFDEPSAWTVLNTLALANLDKWVPQLFGDAAVYQPGTKGYRVSSKKLGRQLEEDLSIHPSGIKDWGVHDIGDMRQGNRSPIDVVTEFRQIDKFAAFRWLDAQLRGDYSGNDESTTTADQTGTATNAAAGALSVAQWLERELPKPDFILGKWLTTTSRSMLYATTGIGKTMFALAMAAAMASGRPFLHWSVARPSRVLLIDGEMARRVMKDRIAAEVQRLGGVIPETMFVLSHEDVERFAPLNTLDGRVYINDEIKRLGGVDFVIFDNIMSLISGDMKEEESWRQTLPWIRSLTRRSIGQLWLHHTGHDASHSYGTKTREWQLDNLIRLETIERPGIDVSFKLMFEKAREREPANRRDFEDVKVALIDDAWHWERISGAGQEPLSPKGELFYRALCGVCDQTREGYPAATIEAWREACFACGLLDRDRPNPSRSAFHKYRVELIERNWIACNETLAWLIGPDLSFEAM